MDWNFVYITAGALLNALVLGIWKPWGSAYAGEKGKNFARKEDLNEILAEVRAVTVTQKEIEAKLAGELWNRQMVWNQKRDTYAALFKAKDQIEHALGPLPVFIRRSSEASPATKAIALELVRGQLTELVAGQMSFSSAYSLAVIFTNAECLTMIKRYSDGGTAITDSPTAEWAEAELNNLRLHLGRLPTVAKQDLGIT
jgi:hypothetical protein